MGHDQSNLSGFELDERVVEVTEFWTQHTATINSGNLISVLVGEPLVGGLLWISKTPLEKAAKNLMLYRHPCILKYISSWHKSSKFYLAVEYVKPLSMVLNTQNTLQICAGLYSVLKAVCFLHDTAHASHNNVCISSIYVTNDGSWRLGGMEYLCRYMDLTDDYLSKSRKYRYNNAIDKNEDKNVKSNSERPYVIDCYAYGVLVNEVLAEKSDDDIVFLESFKSFCKDQLQNADNLLRPKLSSLLEHEFFTHDFIIIYSFLTELPLKTNDSRITFFMTITNKLRSFNEIVVASQLGGLLLSRMVLLDKTAQEELLPVVLCPREDVDDTTSGLFSSDNFKKYIIPRLLQIFCVRDAQIRLLLLKYFQYYINSFTVEELESHILPELLVGIKDTNDQLVTVTLRALADIVPILGAAVVIGGKRAKLFNDGRPIIHPTRNPRRDSGKSNTVQNESLQLTKVQDVVNLAVEINQVLELPERPSPDGEEGETSTELEQSAEDDLDNWEDWDANEDNNLAASNVVPTNSSNNEDNEQSKLQTLELQQQESSISVFESQLKYSSLKKKLLPDITELDIKNQVDPINNNDEFDFFQDMEPVIESSKNYVISVSNSDITSKEKDENSLSTRLNFGISEVTKTEEGWGDEIEWD